MDWPWDAADYRGKKCEFDCQHTLQGQMLQFRTDYNKDIGTQLPVKNESVFAITCYVGETTLRQVCICLTL